MPQDAPLDAIDASSAPARVKPSNYPPPFASMVAGRQKHPLGSLFGLSNFGVNLTVLRPGASSSLHHAHSKQDEFIYVLEGQPTLYVDDREVQLRRGMVAGFPAGSSAHHLENRTDRDCVILEIGDRSRGDQATYPNHDLRAVARPDGSWIFTHKDGTPY